MQIFGVTLHSYRYGWAERACSAGMPEREAQAHLGHSSQAVHRAYAKRAEVVTLPLEHYEAIKDKKLLAFSPIEATSLAGVNDLDVDANDAAVGGYYETNIRSL